MSFPENVNSVALWNKNHVEAPNLSAKPQAKAALLAADLLSREVKEGEAADLGVDRYPQFRKLTKENFYPEELREATKEQMEYEESKRAVGELDLSAYMEDEGDEDQERVFLYELKQKYGMSFALKQELINYKENRVKFFASIYYTEDQFFTKFGEKNLQTYPYYLKLVKPTLSEAEIKSCLTELEKIRANLEERLLERKKIYLRYMTEHDTARPEIIKQLEAIKIELEKALRDARVHAPRNFDIDD